MSCIIARKSKMKRVASVAPDYIRIFPIPETPDMNVPACWFVSKKLTYYRRDQSKAKDYQEIKKMSLGNFHMWKISTNILIFSIR